MSVVLGLLITWGPSTLSILVGVVIRLLQESLDSSRGVGVSDDSRNTRGIWLSSCCVLLGCEDTNNPLDINRLLKLVYDGQ